MKLWRVFIKTIKEQARSSWDLILCISLAPVFIVMYWVFLGSGSALPLDVVIVNHDYVNNIAQSGGQALTQRLINLKHTDGTAVFRVKLMDDRTQAENMIKDRQVLAGVVIPAGFTPELQKVKDTGGVMSDQESVLVIGDQGHPYYAVAAVFLFSEIDNYVVEISGEAVPFNSQEQFVGNRAPRKDFDNYIPGLLIAAVTMIIFSVAIAVSREIESGSLRRLILTPLKPYELLGGISLAYVLFSLISLLLSYGVAYLLGYHPAGSLPLAIAISLLAALAAIAAGLITAGFSRTVSRAAVIANFPLLVLLFFSGSILPLPSPVLFSLGDRSIRFFDFLPTSHAVTALNKVLNMGAGPLEIVYELSALVLLTGLMFSAAVWLFRRLQMR
jgi:ABC-2 type transport system permease protein